MKIYVLTIDTYYKGLIIRFFKTKERALDYASGYDITKKELINLTKNDFVNFNGGKGRMEIYQDTFMEDYKDEI